MKIFLLGAPRVEAAGAVDPRGKKAWGLLTYLLLGRGPFPREHLAEILFANADDPLGALRWNLSELRRLLGGPAFLTGNPISVDLPSGWAVDVHVLSSSSWSEVVALPSFGRDLLEGASFDSDVPFDAWLMLERRRLRGVTGSVLREAAAACLGSGRPELSVRYASQAVSMDPYDEASHELVVRGLAATGDRTAAEEALQRCVDLFQNDLGVKPGEGVRSALTASRARSVVNPGRAAARTQLDLGNAAIKAGAVETGIESLRASVTGAEEAEDEELLVEALIALGYTLVHSVRGRDGEASTILHRALGLALRRSAFDQAAACNRELGYIEMLVARYERSLASLDRALKQNRNDLGGRAWTLAYQAICYSDTGRYAQAVDRLDQCMSVAEESSIPHQTAYALCLLGRIQMMKGTFGPARASLERSLQVAERHGWTSILSWPLALLSDVDLREASQDASTEARLERALSLAQQIGDPCWEGAALRGIAISRAQRGEIEPAVEELQAACDRCVRFPDGYLWMKAYALDALCDLASSESLSGADRWISDLQNLASRTGMKDFLVRAYTYRSRLGDADAASRAALLEREIEDISGGSFTRSLTR